MSAYRKNEQNSNQCDRNDDFFHDFCSFWPAKSDPHSKGNWSNQSKQKKIEFTYFLQGIL